MARGGCRITLRGRAERSGGTSGNRAGVGAALVEPEGQIGVGHQPGVGRYPQRPPVHARAVGAHCDFVT
jgi:hypothetical protein